MMINTAIPASMWGTYLRGLVPGIWSVPSADMEGNSPFSYHSIVEHGLSYLLCAITAFSESCNLHAIPNCLFFFVSFPCMFYYMFIE